ncbi:kinase-like domain-containing protein [Gigaspora rosea]|uniref:Kinase-like domain-containing protein n=1 Tax=Gigaspora rosea TaxID=44941 RepID=A0A397VL31_9GLOM|nr:kinase-like domain-containing protein [Gigaspora rosea]
MNTSNGMYQVGFCYYLGIGVEIDKYKAFSYYLKSAEAGNSMGIWKTAWCYYYGIGVEKNDDKFRKWIKKNSTYGKCAHCNEDNTNRAWCLSCDPDAATRCTSGNKNIDDCTKTFQLRTWRYEDLIEWIPFDRLSGVKKIGEGGFGSVYSVTWLDGIRKIETIKDGDNDIYKKAREPSSTIAPKTLAGSKENNNDFLKEFKSLMACKINYNKLAIYGITQNTETKEYLMVFQYANDGSLYKYLRKNFCNLTWQAKLEILKNISNELYYIHEYAGYIHADFYSGNILQDQQDNIASSYIADLGLSRKTDEKVLEGNIYEVMPYVAPEVLSGEQQFTEVADIYGLGVIMSEMTTGQRPFDGHEFDHKLAFKICKRGLRPEFASGTPKCYIELAEKCMDSDPQKRPWAYNVCETISGWQDKIAISNVNKIKDWLEKIAKRSNDNEFKDLLKMIATRSRYDYEFKNLLNKIDDDEIKDWLEKIAYSKDNEINDWRMKLANSNDNEIKDLLEKIANDKIAKQFLDADKVIKSLPISKHPDGNVYQQNYLHKINFESD